MVSKRPTHKNNSKVKSTKSANTLKNKLKKGDLYELDEDEVGGNSDDNMFQGSDDESIDDEGSDVGWDSSDELAYGNTLYKSKATSSNNKSNKRNNKEMNEDYDEDESDQEEAEDGEMLLSDLLKSGNVSTNEKTKSNETSSSLKRKGKEESEEESEEDSEEDSEEEEVESGSDSEDDDKEDQDKMMSAVERFASQGAGASSASSSSSSNGTYSQQTRSMLESAYSTLADGGGGLSIQDLLDPLKASQNAELIQKKMEDIHKGSSAPKFVNKVVSQRADRVAAYESTSKEMGKWNYAVDSERNQRSLDLAQDTKQQKSHKALITSFEPSTDLEKEVNMVMISNNTSETAAEEEEKDVLKSSVTEKELKQRYAEMSKIKSLLFYEQMKRHRINKIKSKTYRRIRKKQRLKEREGERAALVETGDIEYEEEEARKRAEERMSLKHKGMSKWAKMAVTHGKYDKSLRQAYHENHLMGQELVKKMGGEGALDDEDDGDFAAYRRVHNEDSDEDSDVEAGDENDRGGRKKGYKDKLNDVLKGSRPEAEGKYSGLFNMDFMKKAAAKQAERAEQQVKDVLRELNEMDEGENADGNNKNSDDESDSDSSMDDGDDDADAAAGAGGSGSAHAIREELEAALGDGGSMTINFGNKKARTQASSSSTKNTTSKDNNSSDDSEDESGDDDDININSNEINPWLDSSVAQTRRGARLEKQNSNKLSAAASASASISLSAMAKTTSSGIANTNHGPSQVVHDSKSSKVNKNKEETIVTTETSTKKKKKINQDQAKADEAVSKSEQKSKKGTEKDKEEAIFAKPTSSLSILTGKTQGDLVGEAFAGGLTELPTVGPDTAEEFRQLKDREVEDELGAKEARSKINKTVQTGWGDWAAPGAAGVEAGKKTVEKRKRLLVRVDDDIAKRKAARKDARKLNVILSERRIKTASKFKVAEKNIPYPFKSREDYERSLQMPVGEEWNASHVVRKFTKPEVITRAGRIIEPKKLTKSEAAMSLNNTDNKNSKKNNRK